MSKLKSFFARLLASGVVQTYVAKIVRAGAMSIGSAIIAYLVDKGADPTAVQNLVAYLIGGTMTGLSIAFSLLDVGKVKDKMIATGIQAYNAGVAHGGPEGMPQGNTVSINRAKAVASAISIADTSPKIVASEATKAGVSAELARLRSGTA